MLGDRWTSVDWFIAGFATCAFIGWAMDSRWWLIAGTLILGLLVGLGVVVYRAARQVGASDE